MVWFVLAGLTAFAVLAAIWPLLRSSPGPLNDAPASSEAAFYKAQLDEIQRDVERGQLPQSEAANARAEAARRLLAAGAEGSGPATAPRARNRLAAAAQNSRSSAQQTDELLRLREVGVEHRELLGVVPGRKFRALRRRHRRTDRGLLRKELGCRYREVRSSLEVSEADRTRTSIALHEDLSQDLAGIAMTLSAYAARLRQRNPAEAVDIDEASAQVRGAVEKARILAFPTLEKRTKRLDRDALH